MPSNSYTTNRATALLATLLATYTFARVLQLYAGRVPTILIVVLHVVPPAAFALVHGGITYRLRGILVFTTICLGVGTFFESLSLRTGFPFGHYYFTDVMGPKVFQLPVFLALAYLGMGYLSWIVARIILGIDMQRPRGWQIIHLPMLASFVMVSWDLAMDPVWTYIDRAWVWIDGGPYFGVPLSNFGGWFLTVFTFYLAFVICLNKQREPPPPRPRSHWLLAVLFYGVSAAGNLLLKLPPATPALVTDPSGRQWRVSDLVANSALISIFTMGGFTLIACARLFKENSTPPS